MILHHKNEIARLLLEHLKNADENSIVPMTDLLTKFAQDLGPEFEEFYPSSIETLIQLVGAEKMQPNLHIVESCFQCMAYIFKYLSRLLVNNLKPTFDLLGPLFAKNCRQPGYVLKFAAESFGFLIRKCNPNGIHEIIDYITQDLDQSQNELYSKSMSILLSTTLKSSGHNFHSKTPVLLRVMLESTSPRETGGNLMTDVVVSALDHGDRDTFTEPLTQITDFCSKCPNHEFSFQLLFTIAGFKDGERVSNWSNVLESLLATLNACKSQDLSLNGVLATASALIFADFATTAKFHSRVADSLHQRTISAMQVFTLVKLTSPQVFRSFFSSRLLTQDPSPDYALYLQKTVQKQSLKNPPKIPALKTDFDLFNLWWNFRAFSMKATTKLLFKVLEFSPTSKSYEGLKCQLAGEILATIDLDLTDFLKVVSYLGELDIRAVLLRELRRIAKNLKVGDTTIVPAIAIHCMSWDLDIRRAAVDLCQVIYPSELLEKCILIDDIPRDLSNARNLGLHIRNLASKYGITGSDAVIDEVVPRFCFGLLASNFQPVWSVALEVFPKLYERNPDTTWDLAYEWIKNPPRQQSLFGTEDLQPQLDKVHVYESKSLDKLEHEGSVVFAEFRDPIMTLKKAAASIVNLTVPTSLRYMAIKSLNNSPKVAESHANSLVPFVIGDENDDAPEYEFRDKVVLLELFSQFTKPKKSLRDFNEVYQQYLYYLGSRHAKLQKLAVKCILSVNDPETDILRKYRSNIEALTDNSRFKDEAVTLFSTRSEEEHAVHTKDRKVLIPIAVRILYGHAQNTKSSSGGSRANYRHVVLSTVHQYFEPEYQRLFVTIATSQVTFEPTPESIRRQLGMMSLLYDFISELQGQCANVFDLLIETLLQVYKVLLVSSERSLRQSSTKSLDKLLTYLPDLDAWETYMPRILETLVKPKLSTMSRDNYENPSAMLHVFHTLSSEMNLAKYLGWESCAILKAMSAILDFEQVKERVVCLIFEVATNLLELNLFLESFQSKLLDKMPELLSRKFATPTVELLVNVLLRLSQRGGYSREIQDKIISVILKVFESNSVTSTNARSGLFESLLALLPGCAENLVREAYRSLSELFRKITNITARVKLAECYQAFGERIPEYKQAGDLILELSACDARQLGAPDFQRRLKAFEQINESEYENITTVTWSTLLNVMLFFLKDPEELALRNNAVYSIKRFIFSNADQQLVDEVLLPAVRNGLREPNETFRVLFVEILGFLAKSDILPSLKPLLMDGDDEADFFQNILHIQYHRRVKAVQRLKNFELDGSTVAHYILPLIEHFVVKPSSKRPELTTLSNETVITIGYLARELTWNQYKAVCRRYVANVVKKPQELRKNVRLVNAVGESLPFQTPPSQNQLTKFCLEEMVEPLHKFMTLKSNTEENLPDRVPLGLSIVLFLKVLTQEQISNILPGKLTWLCQLLRAKAQELRDLVRNTLAKISVLLGPTYLSFILRELQFALTRGPQLHVLGYTTHTLLLEMKTRAKVGQIDPSATVLSEIIINDIVGATGQEKDEENYITGAKEVKQNKSYDSAEITSSLLSLASFGILIKPIREYVLHTKLRSKNEKKVQELLKRIASGLRSNEQARTQEAVIMCYQLNKMSEPEIQEISEGVQVSERQAVLDEAKKQSEEFYTVRLSSRVSSETPKDLQWNNLYLIQAFILEALRIVLGFEGLLTPANIKGLLPIISRGIDSTYEDVQISALRLATYCFKVPGLEVSNLGIRALQLLKTTSSTSSDLFQACLKLLTVLIRYVPDFSLKDTAYAYLLNRIKADIEEPDRQGVAIAFIRRLLSRKVMIPQIYDIMNDIAQVLVTNQDPVIRTACRAAYAQFLLEYPHGQQKFDKQLAALVSNLEYPTPSGRLSVLEMIRLVLNKVDESQIDTCLTSFFVGLVLVLINDDDQECHDKAFSLVQLILVRAAEGNQPALQSIVNYCESWLSKSAAFVRGAFEVMTAMPEGLLQEYPVLMSKANSTSRKILEFSKKESEGEVEWQLVYYALKYINEQALDENWMKLVESTLLFPHPWVRAISTRLFGKYYAQAKREDFEIPIDDLNNQARRFIRQLGAPRVSETDGVQIVKNLLFIAQQWEKEGSVITSNETEVKCIEYLANKLSILARSDINVEEHLGSKLAIIQLFALLCQTLSKSSLEMISLECITALYLLTDQIENEQARVLAQESLDIFESKLGTTEYLKCYNEARQVVNERRRERRAKRSIEAVSNPELHARKKLKKNMKKGQSRKRNEKKRRMNY